MDDSITYQFQSMAMQALVCCAITFVGSGLGCAFWIDFRRRTGRGWARAGTVVWVLGTLIGLGFGMLSTQPGQVTRLTASRSGLRLESGLLGPTVELAWSEVRVVDIQRDRLVVETGRGAVFTSAVVYRGDQQKLLWSIAARRPASDQ